MFWVRTGELARSQMELPVSEYVSFSDRKSVETTDLIKVKVCKWSNLLNDAELRNIRRTYTLFVKRVKNLNWSAMVTRIRIAVCLI